MLFLLCSCFQFTALQVRVYVLGMFGKGIKITFLKCVFPFCFLFEILKGVFYGCNWHYSPLDRAEVAKYGGRASVGPQQCRVSL